MFQRLSWYNWPAARRFVVEKNFGISVTKDMASAKYVKKVDYGEAFYIDQEADKRVTFSRRSSRREKFLCGALVVFAATAIALSILYAMQILKKDEKDNAVNAGKEDTTSAPSKGESSVCMSSDCVLFSSGKSIQ